MGSFYSQSSPTTTQYLLSSPFFPQYPSFSLIHYSTQPQRSCQKDLQGTLLTVLVAVTPIEMLLLAVPLLSFVDGVRLWALWQW